MPFMLTPPLFVKGETAVAILRANDTDDPEPLAISMAGWPALRLFCHWKREIEMLLTGVRDRCCIVGGLTVLEGVTVPSEWWTAYLREGSVRLRYQVLRVSSVDGWLDPNHWWEQMSSYAGPSLGEPPASEWNVSREEIVDWLAQSEVLLAAAEAIASEGEEEEEDDE